MCQEAQGHKGIWLERHITGEPTQRMHFITSPAGGEEDQEGCLKSEVLQIGLHKCLVGRKAKSWEDQQEAPGGGPVRGLSIRQICTPDEIPEERIIRNSGPTHLTDRGADSRPVHLDRGCWKTLVAGQKGQEVCQLTWRRVIWWDRMIHTPSDPMRTVYAMSVWMVSMLHQAEHRGGSTSWRQREDSESRTEARREGAASLGFHMEPLPWAEEETEGQAEAWWVEHDRDGDALETRPGLTSEGPLEWGWPYRLMSFWELSLWWESLWWKSWGRHRAGDLTKEWTARPPPRLLGLDLGTHTVVGDDWSEWQRGRCEVWTRLTKLAWALCAWGSIPTAGLCVVNQGGRLECSTCLEHTGLTTEWTDRCTMEEAPPFTARASENGLPSACWYNMPPSCCPCEGGLSCLPERGETVLSAWKTASSSTKLMWQGTMCSSQWPEAVRGPTCAPHPTTKASVYRCSRREGEGEEAW